MFIAIKVSTIITFAKHFGAIEIIFQYVCNSLIITHLAYLKSIYINHYIRILVFWINLYFVRRLQQILLFRV
jgi:hypothetical protein